jgi:hypothetical protein
VVRPPVYRPRQHSGLHKGRGLPPPPNPRLRRRASDACASDTARPPLLTAH